MAKPPPVVRCKIICTQIVEVADVGPTMLRLAEMGFDEISHDFISDVASFKQRRNHAVKAEDFLIDWMADHPTFRAIEAVNHFRDNDRTPGACYTALRMLTERKILKKLGGGDYTRVGDVRAPKKKQETKKKAFDKSGAEVVLSYARRSHGRFNTRKIAEIFASEGRADNSVHASISKLVKQKLARHVGEDGSGQYALTEKGKTARKKQADAAKLNGGEATEAAHG
jgi:hypothetical protein